MRKNWFVIGRPQRYVSEDKKDFKINETPKAKGVSGWLSPEGTFIHAEYGGHGEVACETAQNVQGERLFELLGYIRFTCRPLPDDATEAFVFFPQQFGYTGEITYSQLEWIEDNMAEMAESQKSQIMQYMRYIYGREHSSVLDMGFGF